MKSYVAYKNKIQGIKDVSETVKTVEKIAASSVHFLKKEVSGFNFYATELSKVLNGLSPFCGGQEHPLLQKKKSGKKILMILTGDKGLVGGLWHGVVNTFLENSNQYEAIMVIGAKGTDYLAEENVVIEKIFTFWNDIPQKQEINLVTDYIFDEFKKGSFARVDILYPKFVSLAEQSPSITSFLPFDFGESSIVPSAKEDVFLGTVSNAKTSGGLPIFEPSKQQIFNELLQKYIGVFFHKIAMETKLSELSARTVTMEHAAAKTDELIKKTTLNYIKERRRIVTQRQVESFTAHKAI